MPYSPSLCSLVFNNLAEYAWFCITRQKYLEWELHAEPAVGSQPALCECVSVCAPPLAAVACSQYNMVKALLSQQSGNRLDGDRERGWAQTALSAVLKEFGRTSLK